MTKNLYILGGLGGDERVFRRLDFSGYSTLFIRWEIPDTNETIEQYATRLLKQIPTSKPILIGLSFGGLIAVEIAKQIETEKVILIASAKTKNEIPFYYRIAGKLGLHNLLPTLLFMQSNFFKYWLFGTTAAIDKKLLKQIFADTDPRFFKWAISKVVGWKNQTLHKNCYHIHGTKDRILPCRYVNCNQELSDGGHLLTLNNFVELNKILSEQLR